MSNVSKLNGWWKAVNTTSLSPFVIKGDVYKVLGETVGDTGDYLLIECDTHPNKQVWVEVKHGEYSTDYPVDIVHQKLTIRDYVDKLTPDVIKQERIVDIPPNTEVCHTLDLERVQYVGIDDKDGHYLVTLGWTESIKLNEDIYPRKELVKKWKEYHGQNA